MSTSLRKRVEAGAALLDKIRSKRLKPWRDKIDLDRLDLNSSCNCVIGQIYGSYFSAIERLEVGTHNEVELGFMPSGAGWPLTREWRKYLKATR